MEHLKVLYFTMSENSAPEPKLLQDIRTRRKSLMLTVTTIRNGKKFVYIIYNVYMLIYTYTYIYVHMYIHTIITYL